MHLGARVGLPVSTVDEIDFSAQHIEVATDHELQVFVEYLEATVLDAQH